MIVGIGTDIVEVERLRRMWVRHGERARDRLLAPLECVDFERATDKGRFLAKRFAAKEAFAKALGTGLRPPVSLNAVAVTHDVQGKPLLAFCGQLENSPQISGLRTHLSISDEADYALAFVVLETA